MHTPREYHSTALLLPDGRVIESGMGADFGNVPDGQGPMAEHRKLQNWVRHMETRQSFQVTKPPLL